MRSCMALLLLAACGSPGETWLFSLDRSAGEGCTDTLAGSQQYAVDVDRSGTSVTAWVRGRQSVLSGSWSSKSGVALAEAEGQSATSTIEVVAEQAGGDILGIWSDINPTCSQDIPLVAWPLPPSRARTLAITHHADAADRRGNCAVTTLIEPWYAMATLHDDGDRTVLLLGGMALLGTSGDEGVDVLFDLSDASGDATLQQSTRYQLDLATGTGTALVTRTDIRGDQTFEDCVEETPLSFAAVD